MLESMNQERNSEAWHEDLSDLQARVQFYAELHGADPAGEGWTVSMAREAHVLQQRLGTSRAVKAEATDARGAAPLRHANMPTKSTSKLAAWMQTAPCSLQPSSSADTRLDADIATG